MSSRFVSGGTIGSNGEVSKVEAASSGSGAKIDGKPLVDNAKSRQWEAVQQELEAERRRREEQRIKTATGEGEKSLYDILQANKAAKQAAFEEQTKLRNQFRALDDDEVEFLDEVRAAKRAEEERVRRETEEGLKAFRERQKGGEAAPAATAERPEDGAEDESWGAGRKRKRTKDREVKGVRRRVSGGEADQDATAAKAAVAKEEVDKKPGGSEMKNNPSETATEKQPEKKPSLGLVAYGSDSDDD